MLRRTRKQGKGAEKIPADDGIQPTDLPRLRITDTGEVFRLVRRDGILLVYPGDETEETACTAACARLQLLALMSGNTDVLDKMHIEGDATALTRLVKYMAPVNRSFNIIEP